jgi:RNA polymerase sigma factor (sigma-70 family)
MQHVNLASTSDIHGMTKYDAELDFFRNHPDEALAGLYRQNRTRFVHWARGWTALPEADLAEVFQDAVIVFWNKLRDGSLQEMTAAVDTYVFGIGRRMIMARQRQNTRVALPGDDQLPQVDDWDPGMESGIIHEEESAELGRHLESLGDPCHTLLRLAFYEAKRSAAIATTMGYSSEEVVRTQKKRCLDRLRTLVRTS